MIYRIIVLVLCIETVLGKNVEVVEVKAGQYIFNCRTAGMKNPGEGVILLHGIPHHILYVCGSHGPSC